MEHYYHDLLELLKAPQLLKDSKHCPVAREFPIDFESLTNCLNDLEQNPRLGKYVEQLYFSYLQHHHEVEVLKQNLVITSNKKTIGEIDLILNHKGQLLHWEVAYKFYLLHEVNGLTAYFGPQGKDRLDLKVIKLIEHQLPLIKHESLKNLNLNLNSIINQIYAKGWIFYHLHHSVAPPDFPVLNPNHAKGWWIFQRELSNEKFNSSTNFFIVPKFRWLTSINAFKRFEEPLSFEQLKNELDQHFSQNERPVMIYTYNDDDQSTSRGFVVYNNWPNPELNQ